MQKVTAIFNHEVTLQSRVRQSEVYPSFQKPSINKLFSLTKVKQTSAIKQE